jgi:hypothetical protein
VSISACRVEYAGPASTIDGDEMVILTVYLRRDTAEALAAATDPAGASTPPAADCRNIARPIGLALREAGLAEGPA